MKIWSKVRMYYFSGTGNTYLIAKKMKDKFEEKDYKCTLESIVDSNLVENNKDELIGIFFPVAIQSTYPLVWDFVNRLGYGNGQSIFMVDTLEAFSGGVVGPMKKTLKEKAYNCIGAVEIKMATNMAKKIEKSQDVEGVTQRGLKKAEEFVESLLEGKTKWSRVPLLSDCMRKISLDRNIWTKTSKKISIENSQCIKCGICEKRCPVNAIRMIEGKVIIDHSKCISCVRCVNYCPKNAFRLSGEKIFQKKIVKNDF